MKVNIVYFSSSGNTEKIANHLKKYFEAKDHEVIYQEIMDVKRIDDADIYCLGCPAYGVEDIEAYNFRPHYESLKDVMIHKPVILFGSYDWGGGEWLDKWQEETNEAGAKVVAAFKVELEPNADDYQEMDDTLINVTFQ